MNDAAPIVVRNFQRRIAVKTPQLQEFAERALRACLRLKKNTALHATSEIVVVLVSDRRISDIHWRFMQEKGPTDVITFDHGEIFISVETAKENARHFNSSLDRELRLYIVHGLLHLSGFDDVDPRDAKIMLRTQSRMMRQLL